MLQELGDIDVNSVLVVAGWILGGVIAVVGIRLQVIHLTAELKLVRETFTNGMERMTNRIDKNQEDIAYLRGRDDERRSYLQRQVRGT